MPTTFNDLSDDIKRFRDDYSDDFTSQIPKIIDLAQDQMDRDLRARGMREIYSGVQSASDGTVIWPADFLDHALVMWRTGSSPSLWMRLAQRAEGWLREAYPDPDEVGEVKYFCPYQERSALLFPRPSLASEYRLTYFAKPDRMSESVQTNWYAMAAADGLLFACLVLSCRFHKTTVDGQIEGWQASYGNVIASLTDLEYRQALAPEKPSR